jgi:hypothetical protein
MTLSSCIFLAFFLTVDFSSMAFADMPPGDDFHHLDRCAIVVNQIKFPDIVLISSLSGLCSPTRGELVEPGQCLSGYKNCQTDLYYTTKDQLPSINIGLLRTKTVFDKHYINGREVPMDLHLLIEDISHYGGYLPNSNPLIRERIEYSLTKKADGTYKFEKPKIIKFYDKSSRSLWHKALCFLHIRENC